MASQIVRETSEIIRRKLSDPRLQWITITRAKVSPDMREARIYVRTLEGGEKQEQMLQALRHATGYIRREFGKRLQWRIIPEPIFEIDAEAEQTERILKKMTELNYGGSAADGGTDTGT